MIFKMMLEFVVTREFASTEAFGMAWQSRPGDFFFSTSPELKGSEKIAGFDMDHTIVYPKSGAKFAKNRADWYVSKLFAFFKI
jgi:hypothetical protein